MNDVEVCLPSSRYRTAQYWLPSAFLRSLMDAMAGILNQLVDEFVDEISDLVRKVLSTGLSLVELRVSEFTT